MNLIQKNTYTYKLNFSGNLSTLPPELWAIIPDNVPIFGGEGVFITPSKYIKNISKTVGSFEFVDCYGNATGKFYDTVTSINSMSGEEKAVVDAKNRKETLFFGRNIRIFGDIALTETNAVVSNLYNRALGQDSIHTNSKDIPKLNPNNKVLEQETTFYIYVNMLKLNDLKKLEKIPEITIEVAGGTIYDTDSDGDYKFLIPQPK